jgi:hypothetical protein
MKEGSVQVYSGGPFRFDFQTVVESCGLFEGTLKDHRDFLTDLREDKTIDLVVLGTCEIESVKFYGPSLPSAHLRPLTALGTSGMKLF